MIDELPKEKLEKVEFSPLKNKEAISIIKQEDGNWRGWMTKNGKLIQVRQVDPNTVLNLLLTAD